MNTPEFSAEQFWGVIFSTARNVAAVIIAFGVIWGASWYALQPRIDAYFDSKLSVFRAELVTITAQLEDIKSTLPAPRPFMEIAGGGRVHHTREYSPGESITVLYLLRRNNDCPTTVRVQFWSSSQNGIATEYTYDTVSQQSTPSFGFQLFSVRVKLPSALREGVYSYAPVLIPDQSFCPGERNIQVQPSDFFEVVSK